MAARHGGRDESFHKLAHTHLHDHKANAPKAARHQVETEQAGNKEIYIARTWLGNELIVHTGRIGSSFSPLQCVVNDDAGKAAFGAGWIKLIDARRGCDGWRVAVDGIEPALPCPL